MKRTLEEQEKSQIWEGLEWSAMAGFVVVWLAMAGFGFGVVGHGWLGLGFGVVGHGWVCCGRPFDFFFL